MLLLLKVILFTAGYLLYAALGFVLAATLNKRYSASWKWLNSNLGEMIMSMHPIEMAILSVFWPIQLGIGVMLSLPHYIREWRAWRRYVAATKDQKPTPYLDSWQDETDISSLYPSTIGPIDKKAAEEWRHKHEGR